MNAGHHHRWFQFRLRTFVVLVLVFGSLLGLAGPPLYAWWKAFQRREPASPYAGVDIDVPNESWDGSADWKVYESSETPLD